MPIAFKLANSTYTNIRELAMQVSQHVDLASLLSSYKDLLLHIDTLEEENQKLQGQVLQARTASALQF